MTLSRNCFEARAAGVPNREHVCLGCSDCECHATRPPRNFRELVEAGRAERRHAGQEDDPGPPHVEQEELPL